MGGQILQDPLKGKTFNEYPHDQESAISYFCTQNEDVDSLNYLSYI